VRDAQLDICTVAVGVASTNEALPVVFCRSRMGRGAVGPVDTEPGGYSSGEEDVRNRTVAAPDASASWNVSLLFTDPRNSG